MDLSDCNRGFVAIAGALAISISALSHAAESRQPPSYRLDGSVTIESALTAKRASADARYLGHWIQVRDDAAGRPFAIVDKKQARLFVFDESQTLVGSSSVLTGATPGDESVPGVGGRTQKGRLSWRDRTTPAGRFESHPGRNLNGEDVVWFDYDAALAIHRLRPDASHPARSQRLASATPDDNRASLGCVVVPVAFYEQVLRPLLGARRGVVYVLPEDRPVQAWWPGNSAMTARSD